MILISLKLELLNDKPKPAITALPFLGGVLHGFFENLIRAHEPEAAHALGMTQNNLYKYYAVLPPPYDPGAGKKTDINLLGCGIMLYGQARQFLPSILPILQYWREIRLDGRCDKIKKHEIHICSPGNPPRLWNEKQMASIEPVNPGFNYTFTVGDSVVLSFLTPLVLENAKQKAKGAANAPPALLRLTRSLAKRIQALEPELAETLRIGSTAWIEAEEQIRAIAIRQHHLTRVQWHYGSRTKKHPITRSGLTGRIHYDGPIPAPIMALLNWGCWFGAGQGASLGQGMYAITIPE
ncbi:Uncharacterized conserved protein [Nitrosomonas sp. Nm51]|uniref:CRISPR system precrRNA processing endoribonuclease RAMP protein Cas6 n=1 Tax=Nitrosomonas sp. Nm51 TaxID=133720 RepID=UPI0008CB2EE5|nr:CRISPR system precrRNA processing endoribonuclease RAMP protein Cas6 [Nitrosomonas sp. Nm51]SER16357.1 Uncharacterized conserved protein [Nitrosomonas sp. Nm51]